MPQEPRDLPWPGGTRAGRGTGRPGPVTHRRRPSGPTDRARARGAAKRCVRLPKARGALARTGIHTFVLAAIGLTLAGAVYLRVQGGVSVAVATNDLPAYHQLAQTDVELREVPRSDVPDDAILDPDLLRGRYTTGPVGTGEPLRRDTLGPPLHDEALTGLVVSTLSASPAQTLNGALASGDRVQLVLAADSDNQPPVSLGRVLVLDVTAPGTGRGDYLLTVGLDAGQRRDYTATDWNRWWLVRTESFDLP